MKRLTKVATALLITSGLNVSAVPLTGIISMSTTPHSSWTGDGGNVNTIASVLNFGVSFVDSATDDFVPTLGQVVVWGQPTAFATPAVNNPLWRISAGPLTFTFEVDPAPLSVARTDRPFPIPDTLELSGMGILKATGFDPTPGGWVWSGTMNGKATFSFASTAVAEPPPPTVPDSGATVMLLGVTLGGIEVVRRRLLHA